MTELCRYRTPNSWRQDYFMCDKHHCRCKLPQILMCSETRPIIAVALGLVALVVLFFVLPYIFQ